MKIIGTRREKNIEIKNWVLCDMRVLLINLHWRLYEGHTFGFASRVSLPWKLLDFPAWTLVDYPRILAKFLFEVWKKELEIQDRTPFKVPFDMERNSEWKNWTCLFAEKFKGNDKKLGYKIN